MRACPPMPRPFGQSLAQGVGQGGFAFDFNTPTPQSVDDRIQGPYPCCGVQTCDLSLVLRSGPLRVGPAFADWQSSAKAKGNAIFHCRMAVDKLLSVPIITLTRGSHTWSNTSCLQHSLQPRFPVALPRQPNAALPVRSSVRQSPMQRTKTWLRAQPLAASPVLLRAASRACPPATDLINRANGRASTTTQRPSGAPPRVVFSHFPPPNWPRSGRVEGREPCSRKS